MSPTPDGPHGAAGRSASEEADGRLTGLSREERAVQTRLPGRASPGRWEMGSRGRGRDMG